MGKPSTKTLLTTYEKLDSEDIPYYELSVLKKRNDKKYHSFYLKNENETREWINDENQNEIEFDESGGIQKFRNTKTSEIGNSKLSGRHISAQEFDSHAEKLDS